MSKANNVGGTSRRRGRGLLVATIAVVAAMSMGMTACGGSSDSGSKSETTTSTSSKSSSDSKASSSSKDSTKIDADKFKQIQNGMTYDQVKQIIGSDGTEESTTQVGDVTSKIYEWESDGFGVATVTFENDKVVNKAQAGVSGSSSVQITMDQYNQVQTGMTYDQVKQVMGGDGELTSDTKVADHTSQIYMWSGKSVGANATITFMDGKVESKAQYGLDS
ncbi:MAG: DUF3862 domain-containing protein [Parafannyhessea sp.]|uniref:DUF3862 domain-containing protein n=1 Tax=Parafannyhessea sp. TaxID=2847324 RepID=UPI003F03DD34